jgi:plastocyanin
MRTLPHLVLAALVPAALACAAPAEAGNSKTGSVKGTVRFKGKKPARKELDRKSDPFCAKTKAYDETLVVDKRGGLRDVFVQLEGKGLKATAPPNEPVVLDQTACVYTPRVIGVVSGQPIEIRNGDKTLHNVHAYLDGSTEFNLAQPEGAQPIQRTLVDAGVFEIKCDVHPWMRAYAVLTEYAYFSVSAADGSFEIANAPAGTYTLSAWHAKLGKQTATITVAKGKTTTQNLVFAP